MTPDVFIHYRTHIRQIDDEHWECFSAFNEAIQAYKNNNLEEAQRIVVEVLVPTFMSHITHEEELMKEAKFPYIEMHKAEHVKMVREIMLIAQHIPGGKHNEQFTLDKIEHIFRDHVDHMDMQYTNHIKAYLERTPDDTNTN